MHGALHQISRRVVNDAMKQKCLQLLLLISKGSKQHSKIKGFVQIPMKKLVSQIKYKAELLGVEAKLVKEFYPSGVNAYDLEAVDKMHYNIKEDCSKPIKTI
jgi:IS605 OrfB family transposase